MDMTMKEALALKLPGDLCLGDHSGRELDSIVKAVRRQIVDDPTLNPYPRSSTKEYLDDLDEAYSRILHPL